LIFFWLLALKYFYSGALVRGAGSGGDLGEEMGEPGGLGAPEWVWPEALLRQLVEEHGVTRFVFRRAIGWERAGEWVDDEDGEGPICDVESKKRCVVVFLYSCAGMQLPA